MLGTSLVGIRSGLQQQLGAARLAMRQRSSQARHRTAAVPRIRGTPQELHYHRLVTYSCQLQERIKSRSLKTSCLGTKTAVYKLM